jgi:acyl transferase domain-containing protein/NADPH:quinone reductase-like Zn-dependent oxidoreductase/SAM-dependent methyltransferase/acyl carrier protein
MSTYSVKGEINQLDVAVIGISGRFPGAKDVDIFWQNLIDGIESISTLRDEELLETGVDEDLLKNPSYVKAASWIEGIELFDAQFFGYSPTEAELLDPQGRLLLECAWEALEQTGYSSGDSQKNIGVFVSASINTYLLNNAYDSLDLNRFILGGGNIQVVLGNHNDFIATRLSYKLNLDGPSMDIQTACSSSLVAVHQACQSLMLGECKMALAGGASVYLPQKTGYLYEDGMILSPDGHCRPFDAQANGTVFGRGCGIVLLKPLSNAIADGDEIYAVVKGSAVNNDGSSKAGFTAPSIHGQARVISEAISNAGIPPETIGYVEAHGTGTKTGDPIEIAALNQAFKAYTQNKQFCAIGSLKSNIGHLDAASGIAGFIKTVLILKNGIIPASLHYRAPNPEIDFENSPFYVNSSLRVWDSCQIPRRAGVSSFGMGGTNVHVILESAPELDIVRSSVERPRHVLALSAKNAQALPALLERYASHFERYPELLLEDVCFTANTGREQYKNRLAFAGDNVAQISEKAKAFLGNAPPDGAYQREVKDTARSKIAFLFSGQGSQYVNMGRELFETQPTFRHVMEQCDAILRPHLKIPLLDLLYSGDGGEILDETAYTQPALFALEYALAQLWCSWGVKPSFVMGHSLGEYVAACIAGVMSLEDGLKLVAERAKLMGSLPTGGGMVAVFADESIVARYISKYQGTITIAAINGPANTVVSGRVDDLNRIISELEKNGIMVRHLAVSHAFHSPLIDPILGNFQAISEKIDFNEPNIKLISNVSGTIAYKEHTRASYWRDHARHPVRFAAGMKTLEKEGCQLYLEIGPQPVLIGMGMQCIHGDAAWLPSLRKGQDDWTVLLDSLCSIYTHGHDIDWLGFDKDYQRRHVPQPTYPFRRVRHWVELSDRIKKIPKRHTYNGITSKIGHPLLSHRLPTPSLIFESTLQVDSNPWLKDHRLFEHVVFPATGFIEIAFAGVRETNSRKNCFFEDVSIERLLVLSDEKTTTVQLILTPGKGGSFAFEIFSNSEGDGADHAAWILNARGTARFIERENGPVASNSAEQLRLRCTNGIPAEVHYKRLLENGLDMGASFQGIADLWQGSKEAFGRLSLKENVRKEFADYIVHPALLDSCLQVVLAALPNGGNEVNRTGIYVPVAIKKLRIHASPAEGKWSHARLRSVQGQNNERVEADVWLLDDAGQVLIEICGLQLRRVSRKILFPTTRNNVDEWFFELSWKQIARLSESTASLEAVFLPEVSQLSHDLESTFDKLATEHQLAVYRNMAPDFNRMCAAYIINAFKKIGFTFALGKNFSVESILDELGIIPKHLRLTVRYLEILGEEGILSKNGSVWTVVNIPEKTYPDELWDTLHRQYPACRNELNYIAQTAPRLADALTGVVDPLHMLFPDGDLSSSTTLYQKTPFALVFNRLIQNAVSMALKTAPQERPIRILEVGAGTGGTTSFILPHLNPSLTDYCFTDVSPLFLEKASEQFAAFPFVRFQILDIEKDPAKQGFDPASFDLIIGANVIHATHNLRESLGNVRTLLAPGGIFILLEVTGAQRFADLTVGLLDGWWRFDDFDLRPDYPLLSEDRWRELLIDSGFSGTISIPPSCESRGDLSQQAVIISKSSNHLPEFNGAASPGKSIGTWLIFADDDGHGEALGKEICRLGGEYWLVFPSDEFSLTVNRYEIDPGDPADFVKLLNEVREGSERPLSKVVFMWGINDCLEDGSSLDKLEAFQRFSCGGVLHLLQKLIGMGLEKLPAVTLVTKGAVATNYYEDLTCPAAATLWGLGRVVTLEHPELSFSRIDLDPLCQAEDIQCLSNLFEEIFTPDREDQVAFRNNHRYVARLEPCNMAGDNAIPTPEAQFPFQLKIPETGVLDEMKYEQTESKSPGPGEVAIRIDAAGLNFKDVMAALKMYPGDPGALGKECSGVIIACGEDVTHLKAGDEVIALAPGCFADKVVVPAELVVAKPRELSFEQASSIPVNFITAKYALETVGKLKKGERILIHAAAGGVGHAAVQLASRIGAEIYATAGSPEKRSYLKSLGIKHIMDSRSLTFADEIMEATRNEGVDVVLNSLAGEATTRSLAILRHGGRFIELGKTDVLSDAQLTDFPGVFYYPVDVGEEVDKNPNFFGTMLKDVIEDIANVRIMCPPIKDFSFERVIDAFHFMEAAGHIGKIVLARNRFSSEGKLDPGASYLITGGLGGLGLLFAEWMAKNGAGCIVLTSRKPPNDAAKKAIEALREMGADIVVELGDVSNQNDVKRIIGKTIASSKPLRGVIHAAGLLDDGVLLQQSWDKFKNVFAPKVFGSFNLHLFTQGIPLDFLIFFSSAAALLGMPGQGNHAAANAYMDGLAKHRMARGLRTISINWGAWSEVGAAATEESMDHIQSHGLDSMSNSEGLASFEKIIKNCPSQIAIIPMRLSNFLQNFALGTHPPVLADLAEMDNTSDSESPDAKEESDIVERLEKAPQGLRHNQLLNHVIEQVRIRLKIDPAVHIDPQAPLIDLGLDSLLAIELRNRLSNTLGLSQLLPATLFFDYPNAESITKFLIRDILFPESTDDRTHTSVENRLAEIRDMSEEEAEAILLQELSIGK